jgi:hypothetical protein
MRRGRYKWQCRKIFEYSLVTRLVRNLNIDLVTLIAFLDHSFLILIRLEHYPSGATTQTDQAQCHHRQNDRCNDPS